MSYLSSLLLSSDVVYAVDAVEPYVKWITIGIIGALIITGAVLYFVKRDIFTKFVKTALFCFVIYALVIGITLLAMDIYKHYNYDYLDKKWVSRDIVPYLLVPSLITLFLILCTFVTFAILNAKKSPVIKKVTAILAAVCGAAVLTTLILLAVYFANHIVGDGYYTDETTGKLNSTLLYVSAAILIVAAIAAAFVIGKDDKKGFDSRALAFAGITVALSFVLSYIKLFSLPQGGSITLVSMLPVMLFAYVYGPKKGILVGFIYGLLQAIQSPYIVHPAQFLLDYPVAFMMLGLAGIFGKVRSLDKLPQVKFALGAVVAGVMRFISHVLSGVFAFGAYASDAGFTNFWTYSLLYNSFVLADVAIVIVIGVILLSSKSLVNQLEKPAA